MSELYLCHHKADSGVVIDAEKDNLKLNGFFECVNSKCTKIRKTFSCDRYCPKITTAVNVLIMQDDNLVTAECDIGYGYNEARGMDAGVRCEDYLLMIHLSKLDALILGAPQHTEKNLGRKYGSFTDELP